MSDAPTQATRLDFTDLPLVEATIRAGLASQAKMGYSKINQISKALQQKFPMLGEASQIEHPPGVSGRIEFGPGQLLGPTFFGHSEGLVFSLQPQVLVVRWLKGIEEHAPKYPRFEALRDAFMEAVTAFNQVWSGSAPPIQAINMSYVNLLRIPHTSQVLSEYFSELAQVEMASEAEQTHKLEVSWRDKNGIDLRYSLEQVFAKYADEQIEGHRLTTVAGTRLDEDSSAEEGVEIVHAKLLDFFAKVISPRAKKEWGLRKISNE